jgi:transposase-like protein
MKQEKRIVIRYSNAFKHQVIKEIELGKLSIAEARTRYGISGGNTIQHWMKRMGKLEALPKIIRVEKPDEKAKIKELERQIRQLKEALAETQVRHLLAESQFEIVCEQQGLNPEEIKKKLNKKDSSE